MSDDIKSRASTSHLGEGVFFVGGDRGAAGVNQNQYNLEPLSRM